MRTDFELSDQVPINSQKSVSLSLPSSLVTLSLTNNNISSESFPVDFSSMSMLKNLYLDCNPIDSIPDCLKSLRRLEVLSVGECSMLKSILCPPGSIKRLYADDCDLLEKITLHQDMSAPPLIFCYKSVSLTDIEGILKIQDLAQVDNEIICSLGWTDIDYVKDYEVVIFNVLVDKIKKLRVKKVLVSVTILEIEEDGRVMVSECGMSFVYSDRDKESVDHPLSYYKSWKHIIGGDLSPFESTSGNYFLSNYQFCPAAYDFKENFYSETRFKKSFEVIPIPSDGTRKFNHEGQKRFLM
ncbi:Toll/interleukin-1 receptor domain-containing protein [Tanacetum coccineum]